EKAETFDLDQFRSGSFFSPDIAEAKQAFETRTNSDHETGDDRCDGKDPGLIAPDVQLPQADQMLGLAHRLSPRHCAARSTSVWHPLRESPTTARSSASGPSGTRSSSCPSGRGRRLAP